METSEKTEPTEESTEENESFVSHFKNQTQFSAKVRYGFLACAVANVGLLVAADIGAGVTAEVGLVDIPLRLPPLTTISVLSSVGELWKTKSYLLAMLILVMSLCWPYIKMGLAIFCWMAPYKTQIQIRRREKLIFWLDALGKWSLCDTFVLIFIIVCIQIQTNPETLGIDGRFRNCTSCLVFLSSRVSFRFTTVTHFSLMTTKGSPNGK